MQRLIIGDIHGCYNELQDLLAKAGLSASDEIIAIGDIVDRGPDTPKVVEFFQTQPNARSILGNHERKHIKSYRGEIQPALSQVISRTQLGERYPEAIAFMQTFPLYLDLPEAILAHGFWEPGVKLEDQKETVLAGVTSGEAYLKQRGQWPWYDRYDGPKPIIVGHRHYRGDGHPLIVEDRVWAIDTGCVRGGTLSGLLLPSFKIVSVPAQRNYWLSVSQSLTKTTFKPQEIPDWEAESDTQLKAIFAFIVREHLLTLKALESGPNWAELKPRLQAKTYAEKVKDHPLASWLHRARQGRLTVETLRRYFWHPERAKVFANEMGIGK